MDEILTLRLDFAPHRERWREIAGLDPDDRPRVRLLKDPGEGRVLREHEGPDQVWIISTGSRDREQDTIAVDGWELANYRQNPVVLFGHDYRSLPIAKSTAVWAEADALRAKAEYVPGEVYPFAETVRAMVAKGFLNTPSVGFQPLEWVYDETAGGFNFTRQELLEWSIVPVPANPEALVEVRAAGIDVSPLVEWAATVLDNWTDGDDGALYRAPLDRATIERAYRLARGARIIVVPDDLDRATAAGLAASDDVAAVVPASAVEHYDPATRTGGQLPLAISVTEPAPAEPAEAVVAFARPQVAGIAAFPPDFDPATFGLDVSAEGEVSLVRTAGRALGYGESHRGTVWVAAASERWTAPDPEEAAAYAWAEAGVYRLAHHDAAGRLSPSGLALAVAELADLRDVLPGEVRAARDHLARHYREIGATEPPWIRAPRAWSAYCRAVEAAADAGLAPDRPALLRTFGFGYEAELAAAAERDNYGAEIILEVESDDEADAVDVEELRAMVETAARTILQGSTGRLD